MITFDERVRKRRSRAIKLVYADVGGKKSDLLDHYKSEDVDDLPDAEAKDDKQAEEGMQIKEGCGNGVTTAAILPAGPVAEAVEAVEIEDNSVAGNAWKNLAVSGIVCMKISALGSPSNEAVPINNFVDNEAAGKGRNNHLVKAFNPPRPSLRSILASAKGQAAGTPERHVKLIPPEAPIPRTASTVWPGTPFGQGGGQSQSQVRSTQSI